MGETFDDSRHATPARGVEHAPHLVVLLESDRPVAGGARYSLGGIERVVIGRGENERRARRTTGTAPVLELMLPGKSLSARHAHLTRVGTEWALEDTGSTNGTFVNGQRVTRCVLGENDTFEVGHVHLRVNPSMATGSGAPMDADSSTMSDAMLATLDSSLAARFDALGAIAPSDVSVLLLGESGTGKEGVARWIHDRAGRGGTFVGVNCGALPAALVESSLFGHVRGAFSGAGRDEIGFVRAADGGTLFLDEIADMRAESQAALLRVLQEREVIPVGATRPVRVDLRVIVATHRSIDDLAACGEFRHDLLARIAGFTVRLPALRERRDDLGILVATLLKRIAGPRAPDFVIEPEAGRALARHDFPLNIRELEQCLSAAIALAKGARIELSHLPEAVARSLDSSKVNQSSGKLTERDERLRDELLAQLEAHAGNLAEVARTMGKARMQVHRWCRRFGVDPNAYRK